MTRATILGAWVSGLRAEDLPSPIAEKMRDHVLDTIGAAIAGEGREPVRIAERVFRAPGAVPVLVDAAARDLVDAVRVSSIAAHAAEIDDTEGCDHTGAVVVPAVLALVEAGRASPRGEDLLVAVAAGYEVGRRMQNALGGYDAHNKAGWHSTATCGVFASAAATSRLLGLGAAQTTAALAIAASFSAGGWAFAADGTMTKQLHVGSAASAGLTAALLAEAGATGPAQIFDDVWGGFFATHGGAQARPESLTEELGATWHASHSAIKMYAACRSAHPPLDGIVDLRRSGALRTDRVERIVIELSPFLRRMICPERVQTVEAARMSLPISLALLLAGASLGPDDYLGFADADVALILRRISVRETDEFADPQLVRVRVFDGVVEHVVDRRHARGSEHEPFSPEEVREKFRRLTEPRIGEDRSRALIAYTEALRSAAPVGPLPEIWPTAR